MSFVLLKNLMVHGRPVPPNPRATEERTVSGPSALGNVTIPPVPFEKKSEESWIETTSDSHIEAQASPDITSSAATSCPKENPSSLWAKITSIVNQVCIAVKHFHPTPRMVSDAIIGLSDGMTVPFALTAGLSSLGTTRIVVIAGLAELIAGMISMGVGGALGAKAESDGYKALLADTVKLVAESTAEAITIIHDVLSPYGFDVAQRDTAANNLLLSSDRMVDFIMRFHHQEKKPDPSRPVTGGFTIGLGYALGGLIPLIPYFCVKKNQVLLALWISIGIMVVALFLFGYSKTLILAEKDRDKSTRKAVVGGIEMIVVGGVAAGVTFGVVHGINSQLAE